MVRRPVDVARGRDRVLVDMSNLVVGGGLQVGASFLDELSQISADDSSRGRWPWLDDVVVEASEQVVANSTTRGRGLRLDVVNGRPAARLRRLPRRPQFDVAFVVFGPDYGPSRARRRVVGFADVTSLFPEFAGIRGVRPRALHALRRRVSRRIFLTADRIVAESEHVADALRERWGIDAARLNVVPNVLNRVFDEVSQLAPLNAGAVEGLAAGDTALFVYPTRAYPHKNLEVLGAAQRLARSGGVEVRFALTLTEAEWNQLDPATRDASTNVGPLKVTQLPALYEACAGVVFPSLNECFSVTPLEAMRAGRTLVASDRPFVREVAGDAAWYVEPTDPASVAAGLVAALSDDVERARRVEVGRHGAAGWPTARDRATAYLDLVDDELDHGRTRSG
jgi:glycosyltransferase involved in cell wall biosynthesis